LLARLDDAKEFETKLENLISVYPFNEYEYAISTLLSADAMTLDEYYLLRDEYIGRNLYLPILK